MKEERRRMKEALRNKNLIFILHNSSFIIRRKCGFTLIEVLVSVAILSVVLAAIYSTFFLAQRAVEGMDESLVKLQEARRALDILRCELDSSFFREADANTLLQIKDRDSYGKSSSELTFTTFSVLQPGLSKVSYYIEEHDGSLNLFKKIEAPRTQEKAEGIEIIENLDAFSIEAKYHDQWVKTWDTDLNKNTPEEIRISLAFRLKDRTVTLSDIAIPRIDKPI
jgi:prepilin-type N-terminal cleavage/methylation domain-containing protein